MSPKRIQLSRAKGYRKPDDAIVVARPSKWGNPYNMIEYVRGYPEEDPAERRRMAVSDFRGLLEGKWNHDAVTYPDHATIRAELAGHDLACWCPLGEPCHADLLLEIANS